jgi:hypothetical protein
VIGPARTSGRLVLPSSQTETEVLDLTVGPNASDAVMTLTSHVTGLVNDAKPAHFDTDAVGMTDHTTDSHRLDCMEPCVNTPRCHSHGEL